jgi:hypothetical protein
MACVLPSRLRESFVTKAENSKWRYSSAPAIRYVAKDAT